MAIAAGDSWLEKGANLCVRPARRRQECLRQRSGSRSSRTDGASCSSDSDLVQRLQIARRELALESALAKLYKYIC